MSVIPSSTRVNIFVFPNQMLLEIELVGVDLMAVLARVPSVVVISLHVPIEADLVGIRLVAV